MSTKTLLTLSASVLLGASVAAPNATLAQFGPPPGPPPMLAGPPPGLAGGPLPGLAVGPPPGRAGGPPLGGPPAGPVTGLPHPVVQPEHLRATLPVVRLVSMVLADYMVSIAAARPIFAASRVAPRPTAPTATPVIVTLAMATAMATDTGLMRRLRLTPMADPTLPPKTAATTCQQPGDTGASWSVMETDRGGRRCGARCKTGASIFGQTLLPSRLDLGLDIS